MKIKDQTQKKRVGDRLRRIAGQIRGVIQMIEEEATVKDIIQQLAAIRSALGQAIHEEIVCAVAKLGEKKGIGEKEADEMRVLLKLVR